MHATTPVVPIAARTLVGNSQLAQKPCHDFVPLANMAFTAHADEHNAREAAQ